MSDPKNTILFIGFQAPGTRGFAIKNGTSPIKMFGQEVPLRAQVVALEQFSDHADPPEMLEWLRTFKNKPRVTYLVHGEPAASAALRDTISKELGWEVKIAEWMEKVQLT
jgi:metallo-beta-lactamase family protein